MYLLYTYTSDLNSMGQLFFKQQKLTIPILLYSPQAGPIRTLRTTETSIVIHTLETCQAYWVTTTAVNCGARVRSQPAFIDVQDPLNFTATFNLGSNGPCVDWIVQSIEQKKRDAKSFALEILNSECGYQVACIYDNVFTCGVDDANKVTLK